MIHVRVDERDKTVASVALAAMEEARAVSHARFANAEGLFDGLGQSRVQVGQPPGPGAAKAFRTP